MKFTNIHPGCYLRNQLHCLTLQNLFYSILFILSSLTVKGQQEIPKIVSREGHYQLFVEGKPFLVLGAQLWNSSAWPRLLDTFWPELKKLHCNTLEVPVYWQAIEPEEGKFDFANADSIILRARREGLHLALLWFGSYKNGSSQYAPSWILENPQRFPRVVNGNGEPLSILSPVAAANRQADAKAFFTLMKHLKDIDGKAHTVILVQVENEAGTLGTDRDYSPAASRLFAADAPQEITDRLNKTSGSWQKVFSKDAPEAFMAWQIASFLDTVAAAGKAIYPLPMYANCWTRENYFERPGEYPSGGPTGNMLDIWKIAAPHLDFLSPDLYKGNPADFELPCKIYGRKDNMLFIPETGNGQTFARFHFYAIGKFGAKGVAPYGIDPFGEDPSDTRVLKGSDSRFDDIAANYRLLGPASQTLLSLQEAGKLSAAGEEQGMREQLLHLDGYDVLFEYGFPLYREKDRQTGRVIIGQLSANEFLLLGFDARFRFRPTYGSGYGKAEIIVTEQGHYEGITWVRERIWNGDEIYHSVLPPGGACLKIKLQKLPAVSTGGAKANFEQ